MSGSPTRRCSKFCLCAGPGQNSKMHPHDLRRTFATAILVNGEDLITINNAMGHASLATTQQ